ncbi:MAG: ChbG/HpnK family deacetylase, partial [Ignavibacteriales bacterium]|nr:ChbG/HpnK family deacetylase [Ignavibacteriales bacterium]
MKTKILMVFFIFLLLSISINAQEKFDETQKYLIIRCDDFGMCHSVNMAIKEIIEAGIPISVSVMFTCPWWEEAIEILKEHPGISVGVHLTLNSEWKNYRWGPVLGKEIVPSLIDNVGMFFPSRSKLFANDPKLKEFELEITAQVERAIKSGVNIDYIDHHMGAAVETIEMREIVEKLARENGLGIPNYFNENYSSITYSPEIPNKLDSLISRLEKI